MEVEGVEGKRHDAPRRKRWGRVSLRPRDPKQRRRSLLRKAQIVLVVAVGVVAITVAIHVRSEIGSALVAKQCVDSWNSAANGDARMRLNDYTASTVGTPRQEARLVELSEGCRLVVVTAGGMAVVWRQVGPVWTMREVKPVHKAYRLAGHAILSPNVVVCYGASTAGSLGTVHERTVSCAVPGSP